MNIFWSLCFILYSNSFWHVWLSLEGLGSRQEFEISFWGWWWWWWLLQGWRGHSFFCVHLWLDTFCPSSSAYLSPWFSPFTSLSLICHTGFNQRILFSLKYLFCDFFRLRMISIRQVGIQISDNMTCLIEDPNSILCICNQIFNSGSFFIWLYYIQYDFMCWVRW